MQAPKRNETLVEKLEITKNSKIAIISPRLKSSFEIPFQGRLGLTASMENLEGLGSAHFDLILVWLEQRENLAVLFKDLKRYLKENGAIWAIITVGSETDDNQEENVDKLDILIAAKNAGLINSKVVSISEKESAFRLAIPIEAKGEA